MPTCGKENSRLSKRQSEPGGFFSAFSAVNHWASRTFTTNQPSPAGARPEPESSSGASRTARVYGCFVKHLPESEGLARRALKSRPVFTVEQRDALREHVLRLAEEDEPVV